MIPPQKRQWTKEQWRSFFRDTRSALTSVERERYSTQIQEYAITEVERRRATSVLVYLSSPHEVDTKNLIAHLHSAGLSVATFFTEHDETHMAVLQPGEPLISHRGILHPALPHFIPVNTPMDLAFIPALGLDESGVRLGRGSGHLDRFLAQTEIGEKIALVFQTQVTHHLPREIHDISMGMYITENGIHHI